MHKRSTSNVRKYLIQDNFHSESVDGGEIKFDLQYKPKDEIVAVTMKRSANHLKFSKW